jgi:Ca2+-binding RTX toxin-like protein
MLGGEGFDRVVGGGGGGFVDGAEFFYNLALLPGLTLDFNGNLVFRGKDDPDHVSVVHDAARDLFVSVNGQSQKFLRGSFAGFVFRGNGGDDDLRVGSQINVPATLDGGASQDLLVGGAAGDQLVGGDGDDTLVANGGNDFLDGGNGNDSIYGQSGNDTLLGRDGNDHLFANDNARDTVNGGNNADTATADNLDLVTNVETRA